MRSFVPIALLSLLLTPACASDGGADDGKFDDNGSGTTCRSQAFEYMYQAIIGEELKETPRELVRTTYNKLHPTPLITSDQIFAKAGELVAAAQFEVTFETWEWEAGSAPTKLFVDGLRRLNDRRVGEGSTAPPVVVNLLINWMPVGHSQDYMAQIYLQLAAAQLDPRHVKIVLASYEHLALGANHSKTLTVDGHIGMVMGANLNDGDGTARYYDAGFVIEGDAVYAIRQTFAAIWLDHQTERWKCGADWQAAYDPNLPPDICEEANTPLPAMTRPVMAEAREEVCSPVLVATRDATGLPFPSHSEHDDPLAQAFLTAVAVAKKEILIQTPNLNEPVMVAALLAAAKGGVRVDIVLSQHFEDGTESIPGRGGTNDDTVEHMYQEMAQYADACDRLRIRWYSEDGVNPVGVNAPPNSHAKFMAVDGEVVIVGSSNHDVQSWHNSREVIFVADDPDTVEAWTGVFTFDHAVPTSYCAR